MKNEQLRRKPKRTTFLKIFAKAMILPILITAFVGFNIFPLGKSYIKARTEYQNDSDFQNLVNWIEKGDTMEQTYRVPNVCKLIKSHLHRRNILQHRRRTVRNGHYL